MIKKRYFSQCKNTCTLDQNRTQYVHDSIPRFDKNFPQAIMILSQRRIEYILYYDFSVSKSCNGFKMVRSKVEFVYFLKVCMLNIRYDSLCRNCHRLSAVCLYCVCFVIFFFDIETEPRQWFVTYFVNEHMKLSNHQHNISVLTLPTLSHIA